MSLGPTFDEFGEIPLITKRDRAMTHPTGMSARWLDTWQSVLAGRHPAAGIVYCAKDAVVASALVKPARHVARAGISSSPTPHGSAASDVEALAVVLLTPEEVDAATKLSPSYRPPGG